DARACAGHGHGADAVARCGAGPQHPRAGVGAAPEGLTFQCRICGSTPAGGIAQLGERLHGMQEVSGSIPLTSTSADVEGSSKVLTLSSRGLGHHPFTV